VKTLYYMVRFFYRCCEYHTCHGIPWRVQDLSAIKQPCLVRRWKKARKWPPPTFRHTWHQ